MCFKSEVLKNSRSAPLTPGRCGCDLISSDAGDGIFQLCGVNNKPADALAPKVARPSAGMVLTVLDRQHLLLFQS